MRSMRALGTLVLGVGLALSGCGSDEGAADQDASDVQTAGNGDVFNDADVEFASQMIPHHAQAIQMVVLTEGRPLDPEVADLADAVRAAQAPEVEQMVDWLTAWGKEVPETSLDHSNAGHDMHEMAPMEGMDDMPGMMTADEMQALVDAPDADFQDLWLEMMIRHHEGAIEMAEAQTENGRFEPAITLAEEIEAAQKAEIETMRALLP